MTPNVVLAFRSIWDYAATFNNRRVFTPWLYTPSGWWALHQLGTQKSAAELHFKRLDDDSRVYEGTVYPTHGFAEAEKFHTTEPENFFRWADERLFKKDKFNVQLTPAEYQEFLEILHHALGRLGVVPDSWGVLSDFAPRPFVGRTLASLSKEELSKLPDHLMLYCLDNVGGRWYKTLGDRVEVSIEELQADSYEGSKRLDGFRVPKPR